MALVPPLRRTMPGKAVVSSSQLTQDRRRAWRRYLGVSLLCHGQWCLLADSVPHVGLVSMYPLNRFALP